jgi:hypothetical protein
MKRRNALKAVTLAAAGAAELAGVNPAQTKEAPYAEIKEHNGAPTLFLKGKPTFYSGLWVTTPTPDHWGHSKMSMPLPIDGDTDSAQRTASETDTHIYDFFTGTEWCGPGAGHTGHFDFSKVEPCMRRILDTDPKALFHPRIQLEKNDGWWDKVYPYECEITSEGKRPEESYASQIWRDEGKEFLRAYIDHLTRIGLVDRFVAYHICAGQSTEWTKWSSSGRLACGDYSEPMRRCFRAFLRKKYKDDLSAFQAVWNRKDVTFDNAEAPTQEEQLRTRLYSFRDPKTEMNVVDYYTCLADLCSGLIIDFCRTVKEATGGKALAGASYGYLLTCCYNQGFYGEGPVEISTDYSHNQRGGHFGLGKVLASPYVDFLGSPISYAFRGIGGDASLSQLSESCRIRGKLCIVEEDSRISDTPPDIAFGRVNTPEESVAVLRRNLARTLIHGQGIWRAPMGDAAMRAMLKQFNDIGAFALSTDRAPSADVAVITDEESFFYESDRYDLDLANLSHQVLQGLARFGAPFDHYLLEDFVEGRVRPYKLYLFLNAFHLDNERRAKLKSQLRRDGRIAVWVYASGCLAEDCSTANMLDLTGITFNRVDFPWPAFMHITDFTHPATAGLPQDLFWSFSSPLGPLFWAQDPQAKVLGEVALSLGWNVPGYAVKRFNEWTSVYIAVPNIPAPVLRGLARFAGAHLFSDAGDVLYASRELLSVHTVAGGKRTFRLPRRVEAVRDLFAGKTIAKNVSSFDVALAPKSTELYYFGDAAKLE